MRILFNFSFIKAGGGQNVALNFINSINIHDYNYYYVVSNNSLIHNYLLENECNNFKVVSNNPLKRTFWEFFNGNKFIKENNIQIIYTYFGYSFFSKKTPQVIGAADSNLFFPEIDFWKEFKGIQLLKRKVIDRFRIYGLENADGIIFENELLEKKCNDLFKIKALTKTILPSINLNYNQKLLNLDSLTSSKTIKKGLFLCSWQRHKGILLIPELASILKTHGILFNFIITAPNDKSKIHVEFESLIKKYDVSDYISIIGSVNKSKLRSLYSQIDLVFLLSTLESFSNNIIEAWAYHKPLLISDEEWAQGLCGDSALYVNRNELNKLANSIEVILDDKDLYNSLIRNGQKKLLEYPSIKEKTNLELKFINDVLKKNENL